MAFRTSPMTTKDTHRTRWNWAHLLALVALAPYAVLARGAGWSGFAILAVHLFATLAWFSIFERWRPFRDDWRPGPADLRRDATFLGLNAVADAVVGLLIAAVTLRWAGRGPASTLPLWAAVFLAALVAELGAYWLHRLMHASGWWWLVHAIHHRGEALNASNNFTTHPLNVMLLKAVKLLPLAGLGFRPEAVLYASLFMQLQSFATHANVGGSMKWLNYVVGTAELHRWHHSVRIEEALNFTVALPIWDQVWGTYRYRSGKAPANVGVSEPRDYPGWTAILALLCYPLRRPGVKQIRSAEQ